MAGSNLGNLYYTLEVTDKTSEGLKTAIKNITDELNKAGTLSISKVEISDEVKAKINEICKSKDIGINIAGNALGEIQRINEELMKLGDKTITINTVSGGGGSGGGSGSGGGGGITIGEGGVAGAVTDFEKVRDLMQQCENELTRLKALAARGLGGSKITEEIAKWQTKLSDIKVLDSDKESDTLRRLQRELSDLRTKTSEAKKDQQQLNNEVKKATDARRNQQVAIQKVTEALQKMNNMQAAGKGGTYLDRAIQKAEELKTKLYGLSWLSGKALVNGYNGIGVTSQMSIINSLVAQQKEQNKASNTTVDASGRSTRAVQEHTRAQRNLNNTMTTSTQIAAVLGNTIGNVFSVYAVKNFLQEIIQVGGELEKQHVAMRAILGDAYEADAIFKQVSQLSMISPFDVEDLVKYSKQLSAFGIQYSELYDTTKRLSDIAAGVGVDFGRIAYEFGQTSARKLKSAA